MPDRRAVLSIALGGGMVLGRPAAGQPPTAARPVRLLVLGGTGHIGPYFVRAAVQRGHKVSVFSRGKNHPELPPDVEQLQGDRNSDLNSIKGRDWDAVLDLATYGPGWVRTLGKAMRDRVGHYTFISTISVYDNPAANRRTDENSPLLSYKGSADPYAVSEEGAWYGALKVLCEHEADRQFPGKTLILRPGYIGGPDDTHGILTYWIVRARKGGQMLAGGDPQAPVQYIDIRDLARWCIALVESRALGTYNAIGSSMPVKALISTALQGTSTAPPVWIPGKWLMARNDSPMWGTVLFWESNRGYLTGIDNARATARGLSTMPLRQTLEDTFDWYSHLPSDAQTELVTGYRKRPDGNGFMANTSSWSAYLAHESQALADWRAGPAAKSVSSQRN